jgi:tetratricopeptide (TPR) repeat protein
MDSLIPQHPDPQIDALLQACSRHILSVEITGVRKALDPKASRLPTDEQIEGVYAIACGLCDEGNFNFAAPIALHLSTFQPTNARFSFLAATCLQRLGLFANAAQLYGFTLINGGDDAATLYRLGECLLALGDNENAAQALEAAFDLSREAPDGAQLQAMSEQMIQAARAGSRQFPKETQS